MACLIAQCRYSTELQQCTARKCLMAYGIITDAVNIYGLCPDLVMRALKVPTSLHVGYGTLGRLFSSWAPLGLSRLLL